MSGNDLDGLYVRRTREDWLLNAYNALRTRFRERADVVLPEMIRLSVGFGYGAVAENRVILGQTWATWKSDDKINQVFLSPEMDDPAYLLGVLVHEIVHVVDDCEHKHRKPFRDLALAVGLEGKMTEVHVTKELGEYLEFLAFELGVYPHSALEVARTSVLVGPDGAPIREIPGSSGPKRQVNRQLKYECPSCGWTGRAAASWLRTSVPVCGTDGTQMLITDKHWKG